MIAQEESFQSYLRGEVEVAGQRYDQAVEEVFALLGGEPEPDLFYATQALSDDLRLYAGAIRRMATFASHQSRTGPKHLSAHG